MSFSSKPNRKKKIIGNTVVVNTGCSCRRLKLANTFWPRSKAKEPSHHHNKPNLHDSSSTSSWNRSGGFSIYDEDDTTTSFSPYLDTTPPTHSEAEAEAEETHDKTRRRSKWSESKTVKGFGRIDESVAVMKDSDDPYLDFRQSMLQMILEKKIYSTEDLTDLIDCFLQLNAPYHHENILRAFSDIWNCVFDSVSNPVLQV
ncbi:hypothetical protein NE237_010021 [Protea cynaroides]|uniref:Transcription repressor n=1 Tax=Protea cynaroides TaxID=273540 RepID=A0A9Q0KYY6_9MAGN|nr:hypothetical protein NE237_010021 [Protea cynaroides]